MLDQNKRFNINDLYNADMKYYKLPKVFFSSSVYSKLSNNSKMAWAILRDRLDLSKNNKWFDEKGDIFFRYSNDELSKILCVSLRSVTRIRKELLDTGLLEVEKRGLTLSDNLYLQYPIVTNKDIYFIDNQEKIGEHKLDETSLTAKRLNNKRINKFADTPKTTVQQESLDINVFADTPKTTVQQESLDINVFTDTPKTTVLDTSNWRTNDTYPSDLETTRNKNIETLKADIDDILVETFYSNHQNSFFNQRTLRKILLISDYDIIKAESTLKVINTSKKLVEKDLEFNITIIEEDLTINDIFDKSINQIIYKMKQEKIRDQGAFIYTVFRSAFLEVANYNLHNLKENEKINPVKYDFIVNKIDTLFSRIKTKKSEV